MDGYLVELPALGGLIDDLMHAAQRISDANSALRDASLGELGSSAIDAAGQAFQDRWEHGTRKIADAAGIMVEALEQTRRDYQRIDDEVAKLFAGGGRPPAAGGLPPPDPDSPITQALDGSP
ncbi:MAG: WXG100 family type VII secretion target [Pseudonocardiaceae bacterium]